MQKNDNPRVVAATILSKWLKEGDFPDRTIGASELPARSFVMEVVYGVARQRRLLEWIAGQLAGRAPDERVLPFLLVGLYQTLLMEDVAPYAAVNETVAAAKLGGAGQAAGFLNAVLRRSLREKVDWMRRIDLLPLGVRESHPDILVERWTRRYGSEPTRLLCRWNNTRPRVAVQPNSLRIGMDAFRERLREAGVDAEPHPFAPETFLVLNRGIRVEDVPGYGDGLFGIRDPSTETAVALLDPQPGETVLDACAAPGGKACRIAERMDNRGQLVAADVHRDRLTLLQSNLDRMRVSCATVARCDLTDPKALATLPIRRFDRILLDVPCTNTGVLGRRPDARWRFGEQRLRDMTAAQRALLDAARNLLRPGGRLVYSTCSLEPEEGEWMIRDWLSAHPDFALRKEIPLFPPHTRTDGVYAASLTRG